MTTTGVGSSTPSTPRVRKVTERVNVNARAKAKVRRARKVRESPIAPNAPDRRSRAGEHSLVHL